MAGLNLSHEIAGLRLRREKLTSDDVRECAFVDRRKQLICIPGAGKRRELHTYDPKTYACRVYAKSRRILV